jgi:crotonobetainyl-CoA:carnitine CoA-transferase CaiB-like acyl-CoA transferase
VIERGGEPALAYETCARRLAPLGIIASRDADGGGLRLAADGTEVEVGIGWHGPASVAWPAGSEPTVQAMSGMMLVHGRDAGSPRRLAIDVASVTAGVLAAQASLAALIGHARGIPVTRVETSALEAALVHVSHRIAAASTGRQWVPVPPGPAPGPPFRSADGHWIELETLDASAWRTFWERIGAGGADLQWAWRLFRPRYFRGTGTLPAGLHEAVRRLSLAELEGAAQACEVSLTAVRPYAEVLEHPGFTAGHPDVRDVGNVGAVSCGPLPAAAGGRLPLAGLRVIEVSSRLQGPLAGRLLQLLGAHVVRVEPPGGDLSRTIPPAVEETGSFFLAFNRGKEFVELDLGRAGARDELRQLVEGADVFLHNLRPDKAVEWELDPDALLSVNSAIVHVQGSGWGAAPVVNGFVGTDFLVQAYSGLAVGINPAGRPPLPSRALLTDVMGALSTAEAALFGLYNRVRRGRGQAVGGSLFAGAMALQAHVLEALANGAGGGQPVWTRLDEPLAAADGIVALSAREDQLRRLCSALGIEAPPPARAALESLVCERIASRTAAECEAALAAEGVACAQVCSDLAVLPADPRFGVLFEPIGGTAWAPRSPWRLPL